MTDILSGPRKDAQTRNLISELRTAEDKADRTRALERVTMLHMPLARSLAHRYSGKGPVTRRTAEPIPAAND